MLDNLVYHLIYRLKNKEAAKHLLDSVEGIHDRLLENPYQFPKSRDSYLAKKEYYEAVIPQMNYIVIFDVRTDVVGEVYERLIETSYDDSEIMKGLWEVYHSWIDEHISDYNTDFYYQSRDYIAACYRMGEVL